MDSGRVGFSQKPIQRYFFDVQYQIYLFLTNTTYLEVASVDVELTQYKSNSAPLIYRKSVC